MFLNDEKTKFQIDIYIFTKEERKPEPVLQDSLNLTRLRKL